MDTLADRLKAARAEASLTQQQLADLCRVSQSTIAGIERGRNTRGSLMLPRIASVLRVNVLWLAEGRGAKRQPGNGAGPSMSRRKEAFFCPSLAQRYLTSSASVLKVGAH